MRLLQAEQRFMATAVQQLKESIAGNTAEARHGEATDLVKCKLAYVDALPQVFLKAGTAGEVWPAHSDAIYLVDDVVLKTLGVSEDKAKAWFSEKREVPLSTKDAREKRTTPRTVPTTKTFNDRRATFFMQLGQAAVDAWKERAKFPTDADGAVTAAVGWLNADKDLKSEEGFSGVFMAVLAVFRSLESEAAFWTPPDDVRVIGHVRALLSHVPFSFTKVSSVRMA